jgi:hypothetical protein
MSRLVATAGHDNPGSFLREGQCRGTADTVKAPVIRTTGAVINVLL